MLYLSLGSNGVLDGMAHEGPEARGVMYLICFATIYIRCLRNLQIQIHGWKKKAFKFPTFTFNHSDFLCFV